MVQRNDELYESVSFDLRAAVIMKFIRYSLLAWLVAIGCGGRVAPAAGELIPTGAAAGGHGSGAGETTLGGSAPLGTNPTPPAPMDCNRTACGSGAECILGACMSKARNCNRSQVICGEPRHACPPGKTASVTNGCWGECVQVSTCENLENCDVCAENKVTCVEWEGEHQSTFGCRDHTQECPFQNCICLGYLCGGRSCADAGVDAAGTLRVTCTSIPN